MQKRSLEETYLVDEDGNEYEDVYSLSWRYLGMYLDCDLQNRRILNDNGWCSRKIMWAAYHDPEYNGGSIGEYKFFDWEANSWDGSTCQTERCAPLDCHERGTDFHLVGVFTETDGLEDWAEQLFKHQGYCLWDGDKDQDGGEDNDDVTEQSDYNFMQNQRELWSQECQELEWNDAEGNSLYYGVKPLPQGYMTFGVFIDAYCTIEAGDLTLEEYMMQYYSAKEYTAEESEALIEKQLYIIDRWNDRLNDYKVCQPCSAYNRVPMMGQNRHRFLNDGQGDNEQWGYNCYDDAGYTNCNQCYKFETQTDMALATTTDLERASAQGTIVSIKVGGVVYGKGGIRERMEFPERSIYGLIIFLCLFWAGFLYFARRMVARRIRRFFRYLTQPEELKQNLAQDDTVTYNGGSDMHSSSDEDSVVYHEAVDDFMDDMSTNSAKEKAGAVLSAVETRINQQQQRIDSLKCELDMERVRRALERDRLQSNVKSLEAELLERTLGAENSLT